MKSGQVRIIVVGGGPAGMTASIFARKNGAIVTLVEKNDRIGKKLINTGNGRCNLTNLHVSGSNYHSKTAGFPSLILENFSNIDTIEFFKDLGLEITSEENGRIFPQSMQASSVLDLLKIELESLGVDIACRTDISSIISDRNGGFELSEKSGRLLNCDRVILACGGNAAPRTGSDGRGYKLAQMMGHTLVKPFPALVQLKLAGNDHRAMERMFWTGGITLYLNGNKSGFSKGDIIFTNYGISGLAALEISRCAAEGISGGMTAELGIDFLPELSLEEKVSFVKKRKEEHPELPLEHFFTGVINKRIGQMILKKAGLKLADKAAGMSPGDINSVALILHSWKFTVTGTAGWDSAQVTAGGVDCSEIDGKTLESRLSKGLYFCGEILDVDGDSGGYNLQWAWSSGFTAGTSASGSLPFDSGGGL